jgi:phosphoribosylformylglycinamidine synthase
LWHCGFAGTLFELTEEWLLQQCIMAADSKGTNLQCADVSEGGLITALLESGFPTILGSCCHTAAAKDAGIRADAFWLGESQSRVVISVSAKQRADLWKELEQSDIPFLSLGTVTAGDISVNGESWGSVQDWRNVV